MFEKQSVIRPQDIVILLKRITPSGRVMNGKELAESLGMSPAEVSLSMARSRNARLTDSSNSINLLSLKEFLIHGIRYCFPVQPGRLVRGVVTGSSASPINDLLVPNGELYVWKDPAGTERGQAITPLYPSVTEAVKKDLALYELLSIVDSLRIGRAREREVATDVLSKKFDEYAKARK